MKTREWCALGALLLVPALAAAQVPTGYLVRLSFAGVPSPDTVVTAVPGTEFEVSVQGADGYSYTSLGAFTLRLYFDPTKLTFVSARSICPNAGTAPLNSPVVASSYVELSAPGCTSGAYYYYGSAHDVVAARFHLAAGATEGTVLYVRPVAVSDNLSANRTMDAVGELVDVCVASGVWGDVDADNQVNSRDALIALSHAVGLPVTGFNLALGDTDQDGALTSRDALAMLSASVGRPPASGFRTGQAIVGRCAPQVALDRPLFYDRAATGAGLTLRPAGDTTFATVAGNSADYGMAYRWRPRVSPDRSKILYVCTSNMDFSGIQRICRANIDGTGIAFAATTWGGEWESSPDWSPDGTKIVLTRNGALYTMNADGTGITLVNASLSSNFMTVAWQPVGGSQVLAFTATDGTVRTASLVDLASPVTYYTGQTVVFSNSAYTWDPSMIEWSPAGDSLAFDLQIDNHRAVVVSGTQASAPIQLRAPVYNYPASSTYFTYPLWTDLGMFFVVNRGGSSGRSRIFLQKADGTIRRVGREPLPGALNNFAPGTWRVAP